PHRATSRLWLTVVLAAFTVALHSGTSVTTDVFTTVAMHCTVANPPLHSFPTRRSSDLVCCEAVRISHPQLSAPGKVAGPDWYTRSAEHTSELQSPDHLVCCLRLV